MRNLSIKKEAVQASLIDSVIRIEPILDHRIYCGDYDGVDDPVHQPVLSKDISCPGENDHIEYTPVLRSTAADQADDAADYSECGPQLPPEMSVYGSQTDVDYYTCKQQRQDHCSSSKNAG